MGLLNQLGVDQLPCIHVGLFNQLGVDQLPCIHVGLLNQLGVDQLPCIHVGLFNQLGVDQLMRGELGGCPVGKLFSFKLKTTFFFLFWQMN